MLGVSVDKVRFLLETNYGLHVSSATVINTTRKPSPEFSLFARRLMALYY